jgi:hypothetical protein
MAHTVSGELAQTYRQIEALLMLTKCLPLRHPLPPMRGATVSPDLALLLYELVHAHAPALVVECGSGVSSLVMGYALESVGAGRLVAFEHDAAHAERSAALVRRHELERQVEIVHAGLQEMRLAGERWQWYGPEVVVVLDDVARPDEWAITERWLREDPRLTLQRIAHEKGTAILTRSR